MASHGTLEIPLSNALTAVVVTLCLSYWCTPHQQIHVFTLTHASEYPDPVGIHNQCAASSEIRAQSWRLVSWREYKLCSSALAFGNWSSQLTTQPTYAERQLPALPCSLGRKSKGWQQRHRTCHRQTWCEPGFKIVGKDGKGQCGNRENRLEL